MTEPISEAAGSVVRELADPVVHFAKRLAGPAAEEVGLLFGDKVRLYRFEKTLEAFRRAREMVIAAGFEPREIPIKTLFPLLEGASLEDDDSLQDCWAALIANAANPAASVEVKPAFAGILKSLSPQEAGLLNAIYDTAVGLRLKEEIAQAFGAVARHGFSSSYLARIRYKAGLTNIPDNLTRRQLEQYGEENARQDRNEFSLSLDLLISRRLLDASRELKFDPSGEIKRIRANKPAYEVNYRLTRLGYQFVTACRPPERVTEKSSPESSSA